MKVRQFAFKAGFVFASTVIIMLALMWLIGRTPIEIDHWLFALIGGFVGMIASVCYDSLFETARWQNPEPTDGIG